MARWVSVSIFVVSIGALAQSARPTPPVITVDRETHVSVTEAALKMGETVLAAHPTDPNRLVASAMVWLNGAGRRAVVAYASRDGGASWTETLSTAGRFFDASDEALAFAPDGTVYLLLIPYEPRGEVPLLVVLYRSEDAGMTWELVSQMPRPMAWDRPFIAVDAAGTLYGSASSIVRRSDGASMMGPGIFTSTDRGRTLKIVGIQPSVPPAAMYPNGNLAVTSEGVAIGAFTEMDDINALGTERVDPGWFEFASWLRGSVKILRTTPAARLEPAIVVSRAVHPVMPAQAGGPMLAVDTTTGPHKDRLYVVWPDRRSLRTRIMAAYSTDKGTSWSTPRVVDDAPDANAPQTAGNNFMPMIAVNREGVVGVTWLDRREDPTNLGWRPRFAASFDGGETWSKSVPFSTRPYVFDPDGFVGTSSYGDEFRLGVDDRQLDAGDTTGMAASADGSFHALWIDNRGGPPQVWSARIRVSGRATRNGSDELDALTDVTKQVRLGTEQGSYRAGLVRMTVSLTNTSDRALELPAKLRIVVAESSVGIPELLNADNGESGTGAVWDLAPYFVNGRLEPHATSKPLEITGRLTSRKPIVDGRLLRDSLLRLEPKILATVH